MSVEQNNALVATSKSSDSSTRSRLVREWLAIYAENYRVEVTAEQARIWEIYLGEIPPVDLKAALERALRECRFFPTIAEIRQMAEAPKADAEHIEAERAWKVIADEFARWTCICDGLRDSMETPAMRYAVRSSGGWRNLCQAFQESPTAISFRRKEFLAAYQATKKDPLLLPVGPEEARRLLAPIREEAAKLIMQRRQQKGLTAGDRAAPPASAQDLPAAGKG